MNSNYDHDRFVMKNRATAAGDEMGQRDRKLEQQGYSRVERQKEASCFNCKTKSKCAKFKGKMTGGTKGVVSFGGTNEHMICDKYVPAPAQSRTMNDKQIKALMKNFKRGL